MIFANYRHYIILAISLVLLSANNSVAQSPADLASVHILKKLSMEELMDVEVTSVSKHAEKLTETSSAIQVITQEDIRHSGATTLSEALRLAANLQVAQVNASQWAISARGFNNVLANKLLVLIDGRVVYTPMYAGVFWDVQNLVLEDIDRIEVISGPGGTLWGANAVNGVINIISKSSKDTKGLFAEGAVGTEVRGLGSLRYGGEITKDISYRVYGTTYKRDNTIYQDSTDANDNWQIAQSGLRVDYNATEKDLITLIANLYDDRPDPDGGKPVIARGDNVLSRWTHTISPQSDFQIQLYYDHTLRDFRNGFSEKLRTYDAEGQHRFHLGQRQEIIYGLGFRAMEHGVINLPLFGFNPAQKSLYLYNAFVQNDITVIREMLRLTLGIKVEHNTYTGFQYQPNARINFTPTTGQTVWAAASRAVRNPSRIDREFFINLTPEIPVIVGRDVKSEEVWAYELGWRLQLRKNLSVSLATFYNVYDNIRSAEPGPPPLDLPISFGNGVEGNTYGIELSTTYYLNDWWRLRSGYTFLEKDLSVKANSSDRNNGTAESNDPSHQALLQSEMTFPHRIEFGTFIRYIAKLKTPQVSDYIGLNIRLAWKLNKIVEFNIVGQNLVTPKHTEFIPASPAPKDIERSVYVKVVCRI